MSCFLLVFSHAGCHGITPDANAHTGAPLFSDVAPSPARAKSIFKATGGDGFYVDNVRLPESQLYWEDATTSQKRIRKGLLRGRFSSTAIPRLRTLGTIGLAVGAFDLGWKIGTALDTHLLHISAGFDIGVQPAGYVGTASCGTQWIWGSHPGHAPEGKWLLTLLFDATAPLDCAAFSAAQNVYPCLSVGAPSGSGFCTQTQVDIYAMWQTIGVGSLYTFTDPDFCAPSPNTTFCRQNRTMTETGMENAMDPLVFEPFVAQPFDVATTGHDPTITDEELELGRGRIILEPEHDTESWFNIIIDPTYPDPGAETFTIPTVAPHETYAEYADRLRALGWLGTIIREDLESGTTADPARAPGEAVRPRPAPSSTINNPGTTGITVETNPEPCADCLGGGGAADECNCTSPSITFAPITDIPCTESFPCGVFVWIGDVLDLFNVAPDAPHWTFDVNSVDADFELDLDYFDSYMAIIRTIFSFVLWIGAIWYVGTRLLGFDSSGDPTDAIDDSGYSV